MVRHGRRSREWISGLAEGGVLASLRDGSGTLRSLRGLLRRKGLVLTDTPIYDQIRQELEAGAGRADPFTSRRSSRAGDEGGESVSVWALVNQHRNGKHR
jgi:hypothetical protein